MSSLDRILKTGVMRIPVAYTQPPDTGLSREFYICPVHHEPRGVVIDYMNLMCADLGVKPQYIDMPWKDHVDALINGDVDMLPKHSNTPSRALLIDFACRAINFDVVVIVRKDSGHTMESLDSFDINIACSLGSSNEELIRKYFPSANIVYIDEYLKGAEAVEQGSAQAWVESPVTKKLFEIRPDLTTIRNEDGSIKKLSSEYAHYAVPQGDSRFLNWINNWSSYRLATGDLTKLFDEWAASLVD